MIFLKVYSPSDQGKPLVIIWDGFGFTRITQIVMIELSQLFSFLSLLSFLVVFSFNKTPYRISSLHPRFHIFTFALSELL